MVREWTGAWVHISEFEIKQPQLNPRPVGADPQALQHARTPRTEFYTPTILPNNPFTTTAASTTVTVNQPNHGRSTGDAVSFTNVQCYRRRYSSYFFNGNYIGLSYHFNTDDFNLNGFNSFSNNGLYCDSTRIEFK
jgi:hypothetical protein